MSVVIAARTSSRGWGHRLRRPRKVTRNPAAAKISYDPASRTTLVVWTNLTVSIDEQQTANVLWIRVLDQIYVVSPLTLTSAAR
jgi:hypothetical protein